MSEDYASIQSELEVVQQELQELHEIMQTLSQNASFVGTMEDSFELRKTIEQQKASAMMKSKSVHSKLGEINNRDLSKSNSITSMNRKLKADYQRCLKRLEEIFKDIQQKDLKFPLSTLLSKQQLSPSSPTNIMDSSFPTATTTTTSNSSKTPSISTSSSSSSKRNKTTGRQKNTSSSSTVITSPSLMILESIEQEQKQELHLVEKKNIDDLIAKEDEKQMKELADDIKELVDIFDSIHQETQRQDEQVDQLQKETEEVKQLTAQGVKDVQSASRMAIWGSVLLGAGIGALIAGPAGAVAAAKLASSVSVGLLTGSAAGAAIGSVGAFVSKKVIDRANGAHIDPSVAAAKKKTN